MFQALTNWFSGLFSILLGVSHIVSGGPTISRWLHTTTPPTLTVRDVRVLRDQLLSSENWDEVGHAYAEAHDRHYGVIHTVDNWLSQMFFETGPAGEARHARAFPLVAQDPTREPDHIFSGPDLPLDETVRRRFFREE